MHEVAHIILRHDSTELSQIDKEMEANVVAFLVLNSFSGKEKMLDQIRYFDLHLINISLGVIINSMVTANKILGILKEGILYDFK
jgi:Zn-dependent peptidase ImmA (M78 family)